MKFPPFSCFVSSDRHFPGWRGLVGELSAIWAAFNTAPPVEEDVRVSLQCSFALATAAQAQARQSSTELFMFRLPKKTPWDGCMTVLLNLKQSLCHFRVGKEDNWFSRSYRYKRTIAYFQLSSFSTLRFIGYFI